MKNWKGNKKSIFSTLGASSHSDYDRAEQDFYATDPIAIDKLLEMNKKHGIELENIWECACGNGHLSKRLEQRGYKVRSTDIVERDYKLDKRIDFLNYTGVWQGDIVTNPPYRWARKFVAKAINSIKKDRYVCMFLKLTFLEGQKRYVFFQEHPPKFVYVFSKRISVARNGNQEMFKKSSAACYAWFIWQKGNNNLPIIDWII